MNLYQFNYIVIVSLLVLFSGCSGALDETVYSSLAANNFFKNASDVESLLNSAYASEQDRSDVLRDRLLMSEITSGIMYDRQGGVEAQARPFELFTWDATHPYFLSAWTKNYIAIYRANLILDKVPAIDMDEQRKEQILMEARFIRANAYVRLDDLFGQVPLITTSEISIKNQPSRPSEEEFNAFVENEFIETAKILPVKALNYGRGTRGAALAQLTKFYINNKKWQNTVDAARSVIDLGVYGLFESVNRTDLFDPLNEQNNEFIYVRINITNQLGENYIGHAAPPGYKWKGNTKTNYATQFKMKTWFYESFDPEDERRGTFLTEYENTDGQIIQLGEDDIRSFKYQEDLPASEAGSGNDIPLIRYADILLSLAEALNEINGPNRESVDLINQVRAKAKVNPRKLEDYTTKESLRDDIFRERSWEFFSEGHLRTDLIRKGTFIQQAKDRGVQAVRDYHVLFPLPLTELNLNPTLKQQQNPGYN
jgi:hypothetical protein